MRLLDSTLVGDVGAWAPQSEAGARVLVLGIGNVLMGDEGAGVHALRMLELEEPIPGVRLLDGGTGGVNLLGEFRGVRAIVMIDSTRDDRPAGIISHLRPERVADLPRGLGGHDFGLKDLIAAAALTGSLPEVHLYTVTITEVKPMCTSLSAAVAAALPELVKRVRRRATELAMQSET